MSEDKKQIELIFWIALAVSIIAFFCPFNKSDTGLEIYLEVLRDIIMGSHLVLKEFFVVFLLFCILLWQPIMAYSFYRYTLKKRHYTISQRLVNYFLFSIGFSVYALPTYAVYLGEDIFKIFSWGYWLLSASMSVMFICYLVVQKEQLIDDDDMSEHLINND